MEQVILGRQRGPLRLSGFLRLAALLGGVALAPLARAQSPLTEGSWSTLPYLMPINPIHCGVTHTGKILVVAGSENDADEHDDSIARAAVYDPVAGAINVEDLPWDVFCNGMAAFADGRFLIVGGSEQYDPFYGEPYTTIYDPMTEKFNDVESMAHGRWYATVTALGDGRLLTFSGTNEFGDTNQAIEIYQIGAGWSPEYVAPWQPPLYPRLLLQPNGDVFYAGETINSNVFHPAEQTWSLAVAQTTYKRNRSWGSVVLLPLRPELGYAAKVLSMGGDFPATSSAEIIAPAASPAPAWRKAGRMSQGRIQMNATLLLDGRVLALGGSINDEDPKTASLAADLFDPVTETWAPAGVEAFARLYHSVSLLLPDATIWVAGGNPVRGTFEEHMEIYTPPYLYAVDGNVIPAPRPLLTSAPAEIGYGATFKIRTPDSAAIREAVLVRPGSVSHAFDMEQRLIGLTITSSAPSALSAVAPPNCNIAPPGYYLLFILNQAGTPSLAKFVHLTATPANKAPDGLITLPVGDVTIHVGEAVNFRGSAHDPDGTIASYAWIFPGGEPEKSAARKPGLVAFDETGIHVVSMTAIDNLGANDPSPPTRTITVEP